MLEIINNLVFVHFCKRPHSSHHVRELSRLLGVSPPTCLALINELTKRQLLTSKSVGRSRLVSAALNEAFIFHKKWTNLFLLLESGLVQKLSEKRPQTLILFGSFARGEDTERSDIDIASDIALNEDLSKYERLLERKIQFHRIAKELDKNLLENIRQGILLEGIMI